MKVLHLPPDDASAREIQRWMLRRLRRTAILAVGLIVVTQVPWNRSDSRLPEAGAVAPRAVTFAAESVRVAASDGTAPRAVPPVGWRRTVDGWQHVSTWQADPIQRIPLPQRVIAQQNREPLWCQNLFALLRAVPPLGFAAIQLAIVFFIAAYQTRKSSHQAS